MLSDFTHRIILRLSRWQGIGGNSTHRRKAGSWTREGAGPQPCSLCLPPDPESEEGAAEPTQHQTLGSRLRPTVPYNILSPSIATQQTLFSYPFLLPGKNTGTPAVSPPVSCEAPIKTHLQRTWAFIMCTTGRRGSPGRDLFLATGKGRGRGEPGGGGGRHRRKTLSCHPGPLGPRGGRWRPRVGPLTPGKALLGHAVNSTEPRQEALTWC